MKNLILCLFLLLLPAIAMGGGSNPVTPEYIVHYLNATNTQATLCHDSNCAIVQSGYNSTKTYSSKPSKLSCTYNYLNKYKRLQYAHVIMSPTWPDHNKVSLKISGTVPSGIQPYDAGLVCQVLDDETKAVLASGVIKR